MLTSPPRYTKPDLPPLDDADRRLIGVLLQDGRASGRRLAQETGLSEANVSRRLARLTEEQTIRVRCWVPPQYLGLHFQATLFMRVARDHAQLADRLRKTGSMAWITGTLGQYDMVAYCCVDSASTMLSIIDEHVLGAPGVRAATLAPILEFYTPVFKIAPGEANQHGARPDAQRPLDETDLAMIRELQRDGRLSYADLAQRIGISATSAADRFRRLTADGVVDIVTFVDPPRMGLHLSGSFLIAASAPLRPLMKQLGSNPELTLFTAHAGDFQGYVAFNCRDEAHYEDLRSRVLAVEGVRDVQPLIFSKLYHESVEWGRATGSESERSTPATAATPAAASKAPKPATSSNGNGSAHPAMRSAPRATPPAAQGRTTAFTTAPQSTARVPSR
ncbi:MAG: Lrp/AsnC family transcriptional regulator [Phycisphaeraceae bacterium]|nr:Lrp/AsnC family transcriptional regulator [Phycisphaeraceae bacterium]